MTIAFKNDCPLSVGSTTLGLISIFGAPRLNRLHKTKSQQHKEQGRATRCEMEQTTKKDHKNGQIKMKAMRTMKSSED